jgi:cell wall assembly regulator SMI1
MATRTTAAKKKAAKKKAPKTAKKKAPKAEPRATTRGKPKPLAKKAPAKKKAQAKSSAKPAPEPKPASKPVAAPEARAEASTAEAAAPSAPIATPKGPPEATVDELLGRLDRWLAAHRADYYARLQPGATAQQVAEAERALGFTFPRSLAALYRWRDGQASNHFASFQHNRSLLSLRDMVDANRANTELLELGTFERPNWWNKAWIPFLESAGGDLLVVDLEGTFTGNRGQVLMFNHDWEDRSIVFPSFDAWLAAFVVSLEAGMWEAGPFGVQPDEHAYKAMVNDWHPGYPVHAQAG